MGRGGDATAPSNGLMRRLRSRSDLLRVPSFDGLKGVRQDLTVLKYIWFHKASGNDHAARLESFYGPQATAYDRFRSAFLWGRREMLAAVAARLRHRTDLVWVDLGGGTGANVEMMLDYLPLTAFKAIYVVDLCSSLCEQAKLKVAAKGWGNVHVVEADACTFTPPGGTATLVTFSYSLSMIPPFHSAVDRAISYLDPVAGLLGVTDFYVSSKYDLPLRQMSWARRFFWRSIFDIDSIDLGPERRQYLDHQLSRVWESNSQGSIPYVPYLRAPYYVWVGHVPQLATILQENKVEAPPMFPPTFLYTQSWEDPRPDAKVLRIREDDVCLTLTSGGCNALNLCILGAAQVVAVDCNPAQSALLELKAVAIQCAQNPEPCAGGHKPLELEFEDVWAMFGEGRHPDMARLYESRLAPYLTQTSHAFWKSRLNYFKTGLYYQGGMGQVIWVVQIILQLMGMGASMRRVAYAKTLEEQRAAWESAWFIRFLRTGPAMLVSCFIKLLSLIFFNRVVLWFGGGVPCKQYALIGKDKLSIASYVARTMDGVAQNSHLRSDNYFYFNCLTGRFARDNCPSYLEEANFRSLKDDERIGRLNIVSGTFMDALKQRKYSKVILMDHMDWMDDSYARELSAMLYQQMPAGGRVIWRSAALEPPYAPIIAKAGFEVQCLQRADQEFMDRVNMYSSFYVAVRK